jgi:uncharacterized membrane protein YqjE
MAQARIRRDGPSQGVASTAVAITKEYVRLVVTEFRLLRRELGQKIGQVGLGVALTAGGAVLLMMALVLLFVAMLSALTDFGVSLTGATLTAFGFVLVLGVGCGWVGLRQLQPENLIPKETINQVKKDFESIAPESNCNGRSKSAPDTTS